MPYEVEIKAIVENILPLRALLEEKFIFIGRERRIDSYFKKDLEGNDLLRLRYNGEKSVVTAKERSLEGGIEVNKEIEFSVSSGDDFRELMDYLGFTCSYQKVKQVDLYQDGAMSYELVSVDGLGDFIEIETIVAQKDLVNEAKNDLKKAFLALGFTLSQVEQRSYKELLSYKK